ncbi:PRTRC system ThiF family protein [Aquimonas sp.]|jgi:PRTRC genetic system ThiF family protein|uniref:PRTRC system ThiF family protein n=1 Tax=Aquimonas sp. TaxID=1872588 RepID=UPI0037BE76EA
MAALQFFLPERWADQQVRIAVVGAGGTGSQFLDQLASLEATLTRLGHPGFEVSVHDGDTVSSSNIGRQRFTAADVGLNKASLLVHRINLFYGLNWTAVARHMDPECAPRVDLIVTCVDKALFRARLGAAYAGRDTAALWLDFGNGPDRGNVVLGHLGVPGTKSLRLPNVVDLYPELATMHAADAEMPSCSAEEAIQRQAWPVNRVAALLGAELLWTLFREGRIETHGAFYSLKPVLVKPLQIDPDAWAFMGLQRPSCIEYGDAATGEEVADSD